MALDLNEYIKMSYKHPNRKVLEGLGASEDLIEYLMETPENTNWNVLNNIIKNINEDEDGSSSQMILYFSDPFLELISNSDLQESGLSNPTPKEIYDFCELNKVEDSGGFKSVGVVIYFIPPWPIEAPTSYCLTKHENRWGIVGDDYFWFVNSDGTVDWGPDV